MGIYFPHFRPKLISFIWFYAQGEQWNETMAAAIDCKAANGFLPAKLNCLRRSFGIRFRCERSLEWSSFARKKSAASLSSREPAGRAEQSPSIPFWPELARGENLIQVGLSAADLRLTLQKNTPPTQWFHLVLCLKIILLGQKQVRHFFWLSVQIYSFQGHSILK